jgi:hypothetical protein
MLDSLTAKLTQHKARFSHLRHDICHISLPLRANGADRLSVAWSCRSDRGHSMRRLFVFLVVVAALVLGVGYWRGWFLVDRERISADTKQAIEKVKDATGKALDKPASAQDRTSQDRTSQDRTE